MNFKKGDVVIVSAIVRTQYLDVQTIGLPTTPTWWNREGWSVVHAPPKKPIPWRPEEEYRRKCLMRLVVPPEKGLVVGRTRRATGYFYPGTWDGVDGEGARLQQEKRHKVVMVEPIDKEQWVEPWLCLEADLEPYSLIMGLVRG